MILQQEGSQQDGEPGNQDDIMRICDLTTLYIDGGAGA